MSTEQDSELRADFVNESRDLLQKLAEQLVELERNSDDRELLNAIFRGFHTVKGGAGFFALEPIVELCHASEDVFNGLRAGRIAITPSMMDVVLEAVDDLREMMEAVAVGHAPAAAKKKLVKQLRAFAEAGPTQTAVAPTPAAPPPEAPKLSAIAAASQDPFSEDEFDKLLDQLHGSGVAPGVPGAPTAPATPSAPSAIAAASADPFKEDEFDKLLDQIHGSGGVPGAPAPAATPAASHAPEAPPTRRSAPAK